MELMKKGEEKNGVDGEARRDEWSGRVEKG